MVTFSKASVETCKMLASCCLYLQVQVSRYYTQSLLDNTYFRVIFFQLPFWCMLDEQKLENFVLFQFICQNIYLMPSCMCGRLPLRRGWNSLHL